MHGPGSSAVEASDWHPGMNQEGATGQLACTKRVPRGSPGLETTFVRTSPLGQARITNKQTTKRLGKLGFAPCRHGCKPDRQSSFFVRVVLCRAPGCVDQRSASPLTEQGEMSSISSACFDKQCLRMVGSGSA
jgi:hypothetical protein